MASSSSITKILALISPPEKSDPKKDLLDILQIFAFQLAPNIKNIPQAEQSKKAALGGRPPL
jgi:hypothetical protein